MTDRLADDIGRHRVGDHQDCSVCVGAKVRCCVGPQHGWNIDDDQIRTLGHHIQGICNQDPRQVAAVGEIVP